MTSSGRPYENHATFGRAAVAVAEQVIDLVPGLMADDAGRTKVRDRIVAAIIAERGEFRKGGTFAAAAVAARIGFETNLYIDEIFEDFPGEMARVVAADVREWVARDRPEPPFDGPCARVILTEGDPLPGGRFGEAPSGMAMRTLELDDSAYVMFVPDADRETYIQSRGSRGRRHVIWEKIASARPGDDAEVETFLVAVEREKRLAGMSARSVEKAKVATERQHGVDGRNRILTQDPSERGRVLLEMLDAAADALRGDDEDAARAALSELEGGMTALRVLESQRPRVSLTTAGGMSLRP